MQGISGLHQNTLMDQCPSQDRWGVKPKRSQENKGCPGEREVGGSFPEGDSILDVGAHCPQPTAVATWQLKGHTAPMRFWLNEKT